MMKRTLTVLLSLALASGGVSAASELPDLGDVATAELSPLAERRLGESIMQEIRWRDAAYLDDPELEDYLGRLGRRLVAASAEPDRQFTFFLVNDDSLNAFAFPGGYIGVHTGLVQAAESESELASVLGHEIAHVTQRHIAQLFGKQSQAGMVMLASVLVAILAARSNSQVSEAALAAGQAGALQAQLGYTRGFEREADRIGLQTLEGAGFDVRGMPAFFERLQRASRLYENNAPSYLRTHPLTQERIADMSGRVDQMRYKQVPDSADFGFVRAKLRAAKGPAADTLREFEGLVAGGRSDAATLYGLARAQLRAVQVEAAQRTVGRLQDVASPFVDLLAAEVKLAANQAGAAAESLAASVARYPDRAALRYAQIDALIRSGQSGEAASLARAGTLRDNQDSRMWMLASRAEEALGHRTAHHRAQAEVYVLRGSLPAAIDQLELARQANDGDFFDLSAVDARMRELKVRERETRDEKRP